jgi:hypothetical protein
VEKVCTRNWSFKIICESWIWCVLAWFPRHFNVSVSKSSTNKASIEAVELFTKILVRPSCHTVFYILYFLFFSLPFSPSSHKRDIGHVNLSLCSLHYIKTFIHNIHNKRKLQYIYINSGTQ